MLSCIRNQVCKHWILVIYYKNYSSNLLLTMYVYKIHFGLFETRKECQTKIVILLTLAPTLLPVLPVLPLATPVNLASSNSCLLGSRLWSSSIAPIKKKNHTHTHIYIFIHTETKNIYVVSWDVNINWMNELYRWK